MSRLDATGRVNAVVQRYLELGTDLLPGERLTDLGADEMDVWAIVDQLETEFDVDLSALDHDGLTVDDLAEAVNHDAARRLRLAEG